MSAILKRLDKGETINDTYEVQFYLGEGAFGEVYRVKHKYLGVQVLKLFKQDYLDNTDTNTLTNEAKILSQLTHSNIVRVFETNSFIRNNQKYFFMTMGFIAGETLSQLMKRKIQVPIDIALLIQNDILNGLRFAHNHDPLIIHRDINPDNVLLSYESEKPTALLGDFGLAQSINSFSKIANAGGRYLYFAPECFLNTYLPTSDVLSSVVVLYKMITGVHPWQYDFSEIGESSDEIGTMVLEARKSKPHPPSFYAEDCPEWLDAVILKSLSKNIEERFSNAEEFFKALTTPMVIESKKPKEKKIKIESSENQIPKKKNFKVRVHGKGFDELAGMDELKETLYHDMILPLKDKELYEEYRVTLPNGMLLYGPPGCGKTFISRKFATEIAYNFVEIKPSDIASIYVHGTQEKIGKLFDEARSKAPTILFIDEIDAFMPSREGNLSHSYSAEVNEFLTQMTDCSKDSIFIIAATNRPEKVDSAILRTGRIDKIVYLGPPDKHARIEMIKLHLKNRPVEPNIDYETLGDLTDNFVSSDLNFILNEASRDALKERSKIQQRHIENVISRSSPSISKQQIKKYEEFKNKRSFE